MLRRKPRKSIITHRVSDVDNVSAVDDVVDESVKEERVLLEKLDKQIVKQRERQHSDDTLVEQVCLDCHRVFFRDAAMTKGCCPYCGVMYEVPDESLESEHLPEDDLACRLEEKGRNEMRRRQVFLFDDDKKNWTDDRKEQISLIPGSPEYEEYIEDLQERNPFRPDDTMHEELESHNEDLVTKLYDKASENTEVDDEFDPGAIVEQQRVHEESIKRSIHTYAVRAAIAAAATTETLTDDQLARAITTDNPVLYDRSVKPEEYDEALTEYVMESTR